MSKRPKPIVLTVLDGWGYRAETKGNAIALARKPNYDRLIRDFSNTLIQTSGAAVGFPVGRIVGASLCSSWRRRWGNSGLEKSGRWLAVTMRWTAITAGSASNSHIARWRMAKRKLVAPIPSLR